MVLAGIGGGGAYALGMLAFGTWPDVMNTGYAPKQPVPFSHKLHAGELKMDCRYCHNTVDKAAHAAIPGNNTCTNCHSAAYSDGTTPTTAIHTQSEKLLPVRESQVSGKSVEWERIHDLADYVYFDHSAHVNRGVSCVECHGRIDKMEVVHQAKPLSMSWCLECHRNPTARLRPQEFITKLDWVPDEDPEVVGARVQKELNINPSTNCSTCHR